MRMLESIHQSLFKSMFTVVFFLPFNQSQVVS